MGRHLEEHPQAGEYFRVKDGMYKHLVFELEDWWDRLSGGDDVATSACFKGNPAALMYVERVKDLDIPRDDEVAYGKIGQLGYLFHMTELEGPIQVVETRRIFRE